MKATGEIASASGGRYSTRNAGAAVGRCATLQVRATSGTARGKVRRIEECGIIGQSRKTRTNTRFSLVFVQLNLHKNIRYIAKAR